MRWVKPTGPSPVSSAIHERKKIGRREFLWITGEVAAGLVLTACGAQAAPQRTESTAIPDTAAKESPTPLATSTAIPTQAPEPTRRVRLNTTWPLGDVPRDATLQYYFGGSPAAGIFNPYSAGYDHQVGCAILYEACAYYSVHSDKTYLWLAESYKMNSDATELDITFRKGIRWSDGTPFSARDVAAGMTRLATVKGPPTGSVYITELKSAVAMDDLNLKVMLKQPDWRIFFKSLTFRFDLGDDTVVQPEHVYSQFAADAILSANVYDVARGWPVSTSPYGVGISNDQFTNFDLRPSWWAVESGFVENYPEVVRLTHTPFTTDTVAAEKLINNEIDLSNDLRPLVVATLLAQAGDHLTTWTGNKPPYGYTDWWPISVWFNCMRPPWNNPDVRWALSYAIDRQQLVEAAWGGAGKPANSPFPEFKKLNDFMAGIKDLTDQYNVLEFNLDKTRALMTKAGFIQDKDGKWVDSQGRMPDADLWAPVPLFGDLGPVIVQQLNTAGFNSAHKSPNDVWNGMADGRASLFLFGHGGGTIDPYDTFQLYRKANILPLNQQSWGNLARWSNDQFEKIADQMNTTAPDSDQLKDLFRQGMKIYYQNLPDAPIVQWFHRIPVNETYWRNWPNEQNPYMNSALWHLTMLIVILNLKAANAH